MGKVSGNLTKSIKTERGRVRFALGIGLLLAVVVSVATVARYYLGKRRKVRTRGTAKKGRIDIPLAPGARAPD